jgi:ribonuclease D
MKNLVTAQSELNDLCEIWGKQAYLAVDTEFIREKTYWPVLCLVQVAWDGGAVAVDPLAGLDLAPLLAVLGDPKITKIFHAARQDLEIFYRLMGRLPVPIVDTQIMALALGYPEQMAYDRLMNTVLKRKLSKGSRYTDWAKRPLSEAQMEYALGDVTHLLDAYHVMVTELEARGRTGWVGPEYAQMMDEKNYRNDPESVWERVKIRTDDPRALGRLRVVAAWREAEAQRRNLPRPWVMKDEILTEIALSAPRDAAALMNVRGLGKISHDQAENLLKMIREAEPIVLPPAPDYQPAPEAVIELLRVLLRHVSEQEKINPRLIASSDDLNNFALGRPTPLTTGWHYEAFGQAAEKLMRGELLMGIENNRLVLASENSLPLAGRRKNSSE